MSGVTPNYRLLKPVYGVFGAVLIMLLAALYWPLMLGGQHSALPQPIPQPDMLPLQSLLVPTAQGASGLSSELRQPGQAMTWRVLASSHTDQEEALKVLRDLRADGFAAYPESRLQSGGARLYHVYVDEFLSLAEASQIVKALERRHSLLAKSVRR